MGKKGKSNKMSNGDICLLLFCIAALSWAMKFFPAEQTDKVAGGKSATAQKSRPRKLTPRNSKVEDGDTVVLRGSKRPPVRLLQVNAPELGECDGKRAYLRLRGLMASAGPRMDGTAKVRYDKKLKAHRFKRTLVYLYDDKTNVNVKLVREGHARPYFIDGERGKHAKAIEEAADKAREERRGIWNCPDADENK